MLSDRAQAPCWEVDLCHTHTPPPWVPRFQCPRQRPDSLQKTWPLPLYMAAMVMAAQQEQVAPHWSQTENWTTNQFSFLVGSWSLTMNHHKPQFSRSMPISTLNLLDTLLKPSKLGGVIKFQFIIKACNVISYHHCLPHSFTFLIWESQLGHDHMPYILL